VNTGTVVLACLMASSVLAAPLAAPGDMGLRHDIQVLADYGAISGPVTTWPLSWDALLADLERIKSDDVVLPNAVVPTFERILARAQREARRGQHSFTGHLSAAEDPVRHAGASIHLPAIFLQPRTRHRFGVLQTHHANKARSVPASHGLAST